MQDHSGIPPQPINMCPLVEDPLENCYCAKLISRNVELAVYYCARNHHLCKIFQDYQRDQVAAD